MRPTIKECNFTHPAAVCAIAIDNNLEYTINNAVNYPTQWYGRIEWTDLIGRPGFPG